MTPISYFDMGLYAYALPLFYFVYLFFILLLIYHLVTNLNKNKKSVDTSRFFYISNIFLVSIIGVFVFMRYDLNRPAEEPRIAEIQAYQTSKLNPHFNDLYKRANLDGKIINMEYYALKRLINSENGVDEPGKKTSVLLQIN